MTHPAAYLQRRLLELERTTLRRKLRRSERRELAALELQAGAALRAFGWHPLPRAKRQRELERIWRLVYVLLLRDRLLAVLVQRVRSLVPPLRPEPVHGPRCGPGCADCGELQRWRAEYEVISGAAPNVRRLLFP